MSSRNFILSKFSIITVMLLSCVLIIVLTIHTHRFKTPQLPVFIDVSYSCLTTASNNQSKLVVFVQSQSLAKNVADELCQEQVVAKQYGEVVAYWGHKTSDSIEFLGKGIADLILTKENLLNAFMSQSTYSYQPVVGFPSYTAYLISSKEKPRLEKSYFIDKRIGLLDYPTSRSGHILPKGLFKDLDLKLENLNIVYASSHSELRELLAAGEVDLISSYWQESDQESFSKNYITPIGDNVSGSRWYLKMQENNTDLLCAIQASLLAISKNQASNYFNHAESFGQCGPQNNNQQTGEARE